MHSLAFNHNLFTQSYSLVNNFAIYRTVIYSSKKADRMLALFERVPIPLSIGLYREFG